MQDSQAEPRTVILGAGFGGLECAERLGSGGAAVTLVDRNNYHLFVPLLYQVSTAALSPAEIAQPIRRILRRHRSVSVRMGEVTAVDTARRRVALADGGSLAYRHLIVATGSVCSYFGNEHWARHAPCPKSIEDARSIRSRLLLAFERAENGGDAVDADALLTTVIVGGGPTGVEMAGAVAELARYTLARDFRRINPRAARVVLVEAAPQLLAGFSEPQARYAAERLRRLGVEVILNTPVEDIGPEGVRLDGELLRAGNVIWGAGVRATPAAEWLGVAADRAGRIAVNRDLSVVGLTDVYAIGDVAACPGPGDQPLPALAQVAKQQGRHLATVLLRQMKDPREAAAAGTLPPFEYRDRGNAAIVGRNAAIFEKGRWRLRGFVAWLLWALVHIYLLIGAEQRVLVAVQWLWRYVTYDRGARLITRTEEPTAPEPDGNRRCG